LRVFIANFGRENYLWPACLAQATIATIEADDERPLRLAGEREAYLTLVTTTKRTAAGISPTRQVASRWFNLAGILEATEGDIWIHREKDNLWWTTSRPGPPTVTLKAAHKPANPDDRVHVLHKPAEPWSDRSRKGEPLRWRALHPKAQTFLFTESTLQQLAPDNAAYALQLINGDDLQSSWHDRPDWLARAERYKRNPVTMLDARQRTIAEMVMNARKTAAHANGQEISRTVKNKEVLFHNLQEFEAHLALLLAEQEGRCRLTDLPLQYAGIEDDPELLCSLDRIDSNGHYAPGNLQIVCRFANRWKNDDHDENFRRLLSIIRDATT
jgi:hypothetical protein